MSNLSTLFDRHKALVVFDTETIGLDFDNDQIIELAALRVERTATGGLRIAGKMDTFIKLPEGDALPENIVSLTGITDEILQAEGVQPAKAASQIAKLMQNGPTLMIAHNAQFDACFLRGLLRGQKVGRIDWLDSLTVYKDRRAYPHKLANAIIAYDLTGKVQNSHRAIDDVLALFEVLKAMDDEREDLGSYGDVVSRQPVDWWTGEPEPGLYIAPESFMEDLAAVKGKSNITIKINSCGGDLYTGIAIHNAIKGLTGHKVVVVEGIAASAASVIACAGDEVQVYPGSMVMIHGVAGLLYDYYTLADLKKLQKDFDASERAIAEIYHAKTGLEVDQLRSMMTRETWMVGQEAIDNGFADTLLTDEGPDVTLSADKKVLLVAGIRHDVKGFRHIPGTIPIDNSIHAAPAAGNKHAAAKNDGPKKEDNKTMTLEEMRAQHPDVVAQIEQQAAETARTQERARIEAIDSIAASVGDAQLVRDAKYGEAPCTAEQLALKAMQKQAAIGAKHLKDAKADNDESGAAGVGAAPNGGEEGSENDDKAKVDAIVGLYNSTKSQNGGKK